MNPKVKGKTGRQWEYDGQVLFCLRAFSRAGSLAFACLFAGSLLLACTTQHSQTFVQVAEYVTDGLRVGEIVAVNVDALQKDDGQDRFYFTPDVISIACAACGICVLTILQNRVIGPPPIGSPIACVAGMVLDGAGWCWMVLALALQNL